MITVKDAITSLDVVGGTDQSFSVDGREVKNGNNYVDLSEDNFYVRQSVTLQSRSSVLQPDGSYSKQKRTGIHRVPFIGDDGEAKQTIVRMIVEYPPEVTPAELLQIRQRAAQLISGLDNFWNVGAVEV